MNKIQQMKWFFSDKRKDFIPCRVRKLRTGSRGSSDEKALMCAMGEVFAGDLE
jgi:hypothetical protein